jgi:tetraacyldisaccharide 4'-kinase
MWPEVPIRYVGERKHESAARIWSASSANPAVWPLQPLSLLYEATVRARRAAYARGLKHAERVPVPVISVGNLTVGGSGKTPIAGWVIDELRRHGHHPALLSSGYADDEPQLHRLWRPSVPVISGKDRVASAQRAIAGGATAIVLDDGFQHLRLARDLDVVLISAESWGLPRRLLPAGAWREPLSAIRRAGAVMITRKAAERTAALAVQDRVRKIVPNTPVAIAHLTIAAFYHHGEGGRVEGPALAVSAIADPRTFARQLVLEGVQVEELLAFPDHHVYTWDDLDLVRNAAQGRALVTTEKDSVKLRLLDPEIDVWVARQKVVIEAGEEPLVHEIERAAPL